MLSLSVFGQGEFVIEFDLANETIIKTGPKVEGLTWIYPNERTFDQNNGRFILNSSNSSDDGIRLYSVNTSDGSTQYNPPLGISISTFQYSNATNTLYGLEQDNPNGVKYLVSINQVNGSTARIGNSIPSSAVYVGNPSAFDETNQVFTFIAPNSGSSPILYSIDVSDGTIIYNSTISLATGTVSQNIMHIDYDNSTGTLYGFLQDNGTGKYHLIEINPETAAFTTIGTGTTDASADGSGTIDEVNQEFIYLYRRSPGEYSVVHLDMSNGNQNNKIDVGLANTSDNLYGIEYDHNQEKLFAYHWESVSYEELQTQWVQTSTPPNGSIWALETIGTTIFAGATNGGVYMSADQGASWTQRNGGLTNPRVYSMVAHDGNLFIGTGGSNAGVYKSADMGASWTDITPTNFNSTSDIRDLAVYSDKIYIGSQGDGIYVSSLTNISSATWSNFNTGLQENHIRSLFVDGNTLYAGTYGEGVWKTDVDNVNWTLTSNTMVSSSDYIQTIDGNGDALFAGNISGLPVLYHSLDNGANWVTSSTSAFLDKPVYAITHDAAHVYAGTEGAGVLISEDNGAHWFTFNQGFKDENNQWYCNQINVRSFAFDGDFIYAGTDCGIWKRSMEVSGIKQPVPALQIKAYPNPVKDILLLDLNEKANFQITDIQGVIHASGKAPSGQHSIDVNALSEGIYIIRFSSGPKVTSMKFIKL
ncbi:MAG: T9SS type A sorting domain-containing protein [Flavobacteriales bacterium]|nr:T9SS type A sorting domain-containing protein [Flavobacteriales bacterium]